MKLTVIGAGYVGLVSGTCLASKGHDVTCVETQPEKVAALNRGEAIIHEEGLPALLGEVIGQGRFRAVADLPAALAEAEAVMIAVGTPTHEGRIDLAQIEAAARAIGEALRARARSLPVIVKSTVVPGTTDTFVRRVLEESSGRQLGGFGLGMNPEFLREGSAVQDFLHPDRVVLGAEEAATAAALDELYAPWTCEKMHVNTRTAELIKYANNALLATQISAVNELANLAAVLGGIDVMEVMRGVHLDRRWNPVGADGRRVQPGILDYLRPGCGFGGSCFPKDVQALRHQGETLGSPMHLLDAVLRVNAAQPAQVAALLCAHFSDLRGRRVLLLGLAFKPETDDVRESAARAILASLRAEGATVAVHDPVAVRSARRNWPELAKVEIVHDWREATRDAEAVVVATAWEEYRALAETDLAGRVVVDARRMFSPNDFPGAAYLAIGRAPAR